MAVEEQKDLTKETLIFYSDKYMDNTDGLINGKTPNALCIPLPKGVKAKKGDILLTGWQTGSGLQRAIVTDASAPNAPTVCYLDLNYEGNGRGFAERYANQQIKPNSFLVLKDGQLMSGAPIAYFEEGEWKSGKCVNATNDKVLVLAWGDKVCAVDKSNVKVLPLKPKFKVGESVMAEFVDSYCEGYTVTKIDKSIGRVWVKKGSSEKILSIFEVTKPL